MPFARPTLPELIGRTTADLVARLEITSEVLRRAIVRIEARVWAGVAHQLYGYLDWSSRQLFAATADDAELDRHGADLLLPRLVATYAIGPITAHGADGSIVPAGTRWQRGDGVQYEATAELVIGSSGAGNVDVRALDAGLNANCSAGTKMTLVSPIATVFASAVVATDGIGAGSDAESDAAYRARILERKRNTPHGGNRNDYGRWAREVSSEITRVWVYKNWMGAGSVGVTFVCDGQVGSIIPSPALVSQVQAHLDAPNVGPVVGEIIAFAPTPQVVDFSIDLNPNTSTVRAAVEAELVDLLRRQGQPPYTIARSQFSEAISIAAGEVSHVMSVPAAAVTVDAGNAPQLGTITWL